MNFRLPLCRFNRHSPDRVAALWDGRHFVSTCVDCGAPIRRKNHKVWLREWLDEPPAPDARPAPASSSAAP